MKPFDLTIKDEKTIEVKYKFENLHRWGRVFSFNGKYLIETVEQYNNHVVTGQKWNIIPIEDGYNTITIVSSNAGNEVYVNNSICNTDSNVNTKMDALEYLYINRENDSIINPIDLYIASIKIYNRALTEEEIRQNYKYEQSIKRGE